MNEIIMGQVRFLFVTALLGMGLLMGYDVIRFLRFLFAHKKGVVMVEDILYWSVMSIPSYYLFFCYNDGIIRWYGILSAFVGGIMYEKGISIPIRKIGNRYFVIPVKRGKLFLQMKITALKKIYKKKKNMSKKSCKNTKNVI